MKNVFVHTVLARQRFMFLFDLSGVRTVSARAVLLSQAGRRLAGTDWIGQLDRTCSQLDASWLMNELESPVALDGAAHHQAKIAVMPFSGALVVEWPSDNKVFDEFADDQLPVVSPRLRFAAMPASGFDLAGRAGAGDSGVGSPDAGEHEVAVDGVSPQDVAPHVVLVRRAGCSRRGGGATVALIDTGVNIDHDEFRGRNIVRGPVISTSGDVRSETHNEDPDGHGTYMAAGICGRTCGIAPDTTLYATSLLLGDDGEFGLDSLVSGLNVVGAYGREDDVDGPPAAGAVCVAIETEPRVATQSRRDMVAAAMANLGATGVLVLVASGNNGLPTSDECASDWAGLGHSFAVGALLVNGRVHPRTGWSESRLLPHGYAPGQLVRVPEGSDSWYNDRFLGGTSFATAIATGIAASIMGERPELAGAPGELKTALSELSRPLDRSQARPRERPAGMLQACPDDTETSTDSFVSSHPRGAERSPIPHGGGAPPDAKRSRMAAKNNENSDISGGTPAQPDRGTWIVRVPKGAIVGYVWVYKHDNGGTAEYHEYFVFASQGVPAIYHSVPFETALTFEMDPNLPPIKNPGDLLKYVQDDLNGFTPPKIIKSGEEVKRHAKYVPTDKNIGWPNLPT